MTKHFLSTLTGSFSQPAAENPTVTMVEAAYHHHGLDWRYLNCEVVPENLRDAVRGARAMGWAGFNCSLPHKVAVIEYLDELAPSAQIIGAVNTVVNRGGRWIGENTDGQGFVQALCAVTALPGTSAMIFGAGGAARAVAVELALAGAVRIVIANRGTERGNTLVDLLNKRTPTQASFLPWTGTLSVPENIDIVVNATSIGLYPDLQAQLDLNWNSLRPGLVVADAIPNPPRTHLIREAEARGCTVLDGMGMLVNQGAIAIRLWSGVEVDREVMRQTLEHLFSAKAA